MSGNNCSSISISPAAKDSKGIEISKSTFKTSGIFNIAEVYIDLQHQDQGSENGVVICTVGMGSEKGVPIPIIRNGRKVGIKKDQEKLTVLTKLNEENLIQIAEAGNGTYTKTKGLNLDLRKILDRINKIEKTSLKKDRYSTYDDQFQWFLIPGILLLLLDFIIFEKRGRIDDQLVLFK